MNNLRLNLIAPKGRYGFGHLVADAMRKASVFIHWWDYRTERNPLAVLDQNAPTLVLRGEAKELIAQVLDKLNGPRFLWYAEDPARDAGREILELCAYYQNIWLHWNNPPVVDAIGQTYSNKRVDIVPVLYADQSIWRPIPPTPDPDRAYHCEVLHYGCLTPRREKILADLRRYALADGTPLVVYQVEDGDHERLAQMVNRAKVILNIHAWSDVNYEIRLAEAISCGAFIVSESLPDDTPAELLTWVVPVTSGSIKGIFDCCRLITQDWHYAFREQRRQEHVEYAKRNHSHLIMPDAIGPMLFGEDGWLEHCSRYASHSGTA